MDAYARAASDGDAQPSILNFSGLEYMNSGGIGLLVTLLVRANRAEAAPARLRAQRALPPDLRADAARRGDRHLRRREAEALAAAAASGTRVHEHREARPRADAENWAKPVSRLHVEDVPEGATNLVEGKRLLGPIQGFGKMWQKTYRVQPRRRGRVADRGDPRRGRRTSPSFWPDGQPLLRAADRHRAGRGRADQGCRSPGRPEALDRRDGAVRRRRVVHADDARRGTCSPAGSRSAPSRRTATTVAQAQVLMRAQDPISELGLSLGGHKLEDRFWQQTLTAPRRPLRRRGRGARRR